LRSLLGAYLDAAPAGLAFEFGDGGKPRLAGPVPRSSICFNVSHSGPLGLFAFARAPVGVDIELDRRPIDEAAVAARAFPPDTARSIAALDPRDRRRAFLRAWARHEAALKCRSEGLASAGHRGYADLGTERQRALQDPWVVDLPLMPGAAAALASAATPRLVRCWSCTT
jgi:4'-phosphopantetheinyl transferase